MTDTTKKILLYSLLYTITFSIIFSVFLLSPHAQNDYPHLRKIIIFFATILLAKYFLYMMTAPWYDVSLKLKELQYLRKHKRKVYNPRVSVIIPAWNEEVGLLNTVRTIIASTYKNLEIVVVNDGSTDDSDQLMLDFLEKYNNYIEGKKDAIELKYFYKENGGKGVALNYGIEHSTGDIIISIDADCILEPDTVQNFVIPFREPKVMAAVGNVKIGSTKTILNTVQYLEFLFSFYFKKTEALFNTIYIIGGAAGAFRREIFTSVGYYNPKNITEDIELSVRIQAKGLRIAYAQDARVYTEGASTLVGLMNQRLRWKRGRFQTFRDHRNLFFSFKRQHNKLFTLLMLPLALFGEVQLFFELYFVFFLYIYSYLVDDFSSFISGIVVVSAMFFVQILFEKSSSNKTWFYILIPIGWILFYLSTLVEYNALLKSIWTGLRKKELVWQKWERRGALD